MGDNNNVPVETLLALDIAKIPKEFKVASTLVGACFWSNSEFVIINLRLPQFIYIESWMRLFQSLPQVKYLICNMPSSFTSNEGDLIEAFTQSSSSTTGSCICPNLDSIELHKFNFSKLRGNIFERFLKFLQFRRNSARPIMYIKISESNGLYKSMVDEIKGLVEEIEWDGLVYEYGSDDSEEEELDDHGREYEQDFFSQHHELVKRTLISRDMTMIYDLC